MPARYALNDGLIDRSRTVFDFGSGRGQDVSRLSAMGYTVSGWDPHFDTETRPQPADTVLLSYVLNVIEDLSERRQALAQAWTLAQRVLVVATRLTWDRRRVTGTVQNDGIRTSRSTFQHLFTTVELRELVQDVTKRQCVSPTPGVVYVFRYERDRLEFIARSSFPQFAWSSRHDLAGAASEAVSFVHQFGRLPAFEEIPPDVLPVLGKLSRREFATLINKAVDPAAVAEGRRRTTLDVLLYLGIDAFRGGSSLSDMPESMQLHIRAHFKTHKEARARANRLLLKLRDDTYLRGAMRNSVGKLTPTALYVHRRALGSMPIILRLYEHCGGVAAGRPADWNVLKLHHDSRRVSWSSYPDFDKDPHPTLAWAYGVHLPSLTTSYHSYEGSRNRPLLHRKQEFLAKDDPDYEKYARLTRAELRAGLYNDPSRIGLEVGWEETLASQGVQLRGHRLIRRVEALRSGKKRGQNRAE